MKGNGLRNIAGKTSPGAAAVTAALVLALALATTGCRNDGGFLGQTLELRAQVWTDGWNGNYTQFSESRTVTSNLGGTGEITDGRLSFSVGRPADGYLDSIRDLVRELEGEGWNRVSVNPDTAMFAFLDLMVPDGGLTRERSVKTETQTSWSEVFDYVYYVFVDRNVTISSEGASETDRGSGWSWTGTFDSFNITLREGWNALHFRHEATATDDGNIENEVERRTLSHADPDNVRWILNEWGGWGW